MTEKLIASLQLLVGGYFLTGGLILAGRLLGSWEGSAAVVGGWILLAAAVVGLAIVAFVNEHQRRVAVISGGVLIGVCALILLSGHPVLGQPL